MRSLCEVWGQGRPAKEVRAEKGRDTKPGSNIFPTKTFRILFWPESSEWAVNSSVQMNENEKDPNAQQGKA